MRHMKKIRQVVSGSRVKKDVMLYRGSYMSAHVLLLNVLNNVLKRDKMLGKPHIFCNKLNRFDNIGTGMKDSSYPMTLKLL